MYDPEEPAAARLVEYQANRLQELIGELHNCCRDRIYLEAKRFNLPPAEIKCLLAFNGHRYFAGREVAALLEVAKSRATVILDSLERKHLVQRVADPNDGRVKLASLTPAGHKKVQEIEAFAFSIHLQFLETIEPARRSTIIAALEILGHSMQTIKMRLQQ